MEEESSLQILNLTQIKEAFNGDEDQAKAMLELLEPRALDRIIEAMYQTLINSNWTELSIQAYELKGPSGFAGADRLHNADHQLREALDLEERNETEIRRLYLNVIVEARTLKLELARMFEREAPGIENYDTYIAAAGFGPVELQGSETTKVFCMCSIF